MLEPGDSDVGGGGTGDAGRAARRLNRLQTALVRLGETTSTAHAVEVVVQEAQATLEAAAAVLLLPLADGDGFEVATSLGYSSATISPFQRIPSDAGLPLMEAARTRTTVVCHSVDELHEHFPATAGVPTENHAFLSVPILVRDAVLGVLGLSFRDPGVGDDDVALAVTLATQAANALERARLFESERAARAAAEAAQGRLSFLAQASNLLSASLDVHTVLSNLADLVVPTLADWCTVDLRRDDGVVARVAVTHADPALADAADALLQFAPRPGDGHPVMRVLDCGEPELTPYLTEDRLYSSARNAEHLAVMRALGFQSSMVVPLTAHDRTFGAVTLVATAESGRRFGREDLTLAADLAGRAALAVDNAGLYERVTTAVRQREESLALLDQVFRSAPVGLEFLDRDLRFVRINDALARIHGLSAEDHIGRSVEDVLADVPAAIASFRRVIETGEPVLGREVTTALPGTGGEERHFVAGYFPVRTAAGELLGVGASVVDLTDRFRAEEDRARSLERERAARADAEAAQSRLAFLAEASQVLARSLDFDETLQAVARVSVSALADWVLVDVVEDLEIRRVVALHRDREQQALVERMVEGPRDRRSDHPVSWVLRSGDPVLLANVSEDDVTTWARDPAQAEVMRSLGVGSVVVVPLVARGRTLGAAVLVRRPTSPPFGEDDFMLAADLARRAALAADNARLFRDRSRVARVLQRSLLPPDMPDVPNLDVHADFFASGEGIDVGGDFYDLFQTSEDEWAVLIGDVCGTGAEAATVTSLARHTLRAASMRARRPARVLSVLNDVLVRRPEEAKLCTVAFGRLRPSPTRARLTIACGGHPMPLLVSRVGRVVEVGRPGTMLGVIDDPDLVEVTTELDPGDAVVFYTDGVTEAHGRDGLFGEQRLKNVLAQCVGLTARQIVDRVVDAVIAYGEGDVGDDVAVLVLKMPEATRTG